MANLSDYEGLLDLHTLDGQDWRKYPRSYLGRYHTFRRAFDLLRALARHVDVVELGTMRSYVHGGLPGCNTSDDSLWTPTQPERWDWGAGCFSLMCAMCGPSDATIHTVDVVEEHIRRCKVMTSEHAARMRYHVTDAEAFLMAFGGTADLVYIDTGDMTPLEPSAQQHLRQAQAIISRGVVPVGGLILIDDVRNSTPLKFGETSLLGKAKYSLPLLLNAGFEVVMSEYQILLERTS